MCHVRVLGRPVYPAFDVEILEPHGKLLLKYNPEALSSVLKSVSSDDIPHMRQLEEKMMWERVSLLDILLRGIQHGPTNLGVFGDEEDEDMDEVLIL